MSQNIRSGLKDWAEWLLFFSSYFPLYIIIAVKTREVSYGLFFLKTPVYQIMGYSISIISIFLLAFSAVVIGFLGVVIHYAREENGQPKAIRKPSKKNELFISYILAHVIPFAFIDYTSTLNFIAFLILFLSIGVVQVRSNYLYINPLLSIRGYDIYTMENEGNDGQMLLAKTTENPLSEKGTITAVELSHNVYITTR